MIRIHVAGVPVATARAAFRRGTITAIFFAHDAGRAEITVLAAVHFFIAARLWSAFAGCLVVGAGGAGLVDPGFPAVIVEDARCLLVTRTSRDCAVMRAAGFHTVRPFPVAPIIE